MKLIPNYLVHSTHCSMCYSVVVVVVVIETIIFVFVTS